MKVITNPAMIFIAIVFLTAISSTHTVGVSQIPRVKKYQHVHYPSLEYPVVSPHDSVPWKDYRKFSSDNLVSPEDAHDEHQSDSSGSSTPLANAPEVSQSNSHPSLSLVDPNGVVQEKLLSVSSRKNYYTVTGRLDVASSNKESVISPEDSDRGMRYLDGEVSYINHRPKPFTFPTFPDVMNSRFLDPEYFPLPSQRTRPEYTNKVSALPSIPPKYDISDVPVGLNDYSKLDYPIVPPSTNYPVVSPDSDSTKKAHIIASARDYPVTFPSPEYPVFAPSFRQVLGNPPVTPLADAPVDNTIIKYPFLAPRLDYPVIAPISDNFVSTSDKFPIIRPRNDYLNSRTAKSLKDSEIETLETSNRISKPEDEPENESHINNRMNENELKSFNDLLELIGMGNPKFTHEVYFSFLEPKDEHPHFSLDDRLKSPQFGSSDIMTTIVDPEICWRVDFPILSPMYIMWTCRIDTQSLESLDAIARFDAYIRELTKCDEIRSLAYDDGYKCYMPDPSIVIGNNPVYSKLLDMMLAINTLRRAH